MTTPDPGFRDAPLVYLADFRLALEATTRVAAELALTARLGVVPGLLQIPSAEQAPIAVLPAIDHFVRRGEAEALDPASFLRTPLAIVAAPLLTLSKPLPFALHVLAERVLAVADDPAEAAAFLRADARLRHHFGPRVLWTATQPATLKILRDAGLPPTGTRWQAFGLPGQALRPAPAAGCRPLVLVPADRQSHWPAAAAEAKRLLDDRRVRWRVRGKLPGYAEAKDAAWLKPDRDREVLEPALKPLEGAVAVAVALLLAGEGEARELPMTAVGVALAAGTPVVAAARLKARLGSGPLYAEVPKLVDLALQTTLQPARSSTRFDPLDAHRHRLRRLGVELGELPIPGPRPDPRRMVMFASNGVGVGHVGRLLSIARRLPDNVEPVFLTMSQAVPFIEAAGFHAEFVTSHLYSEIDATASYPWLARQVQDCVRRHDARAVVFDGANPYNGLTEGLGGLPGVAYAWVRRGMWRQEQANDSALAKGRFFDLTIEPAEIADSEDRGLTASNREGTLAVDPILYLDESELLSREAAARLLGLDPKRPAALIQLGSGANRDIVRLTDRVVKVLQGFPELQLAAVEWPIAGLPVPATPGVLPVTGFPLARAYRALDFTVSAAGYNSFHELMHYGLPGIFFANTHPSMDDQQGRARFAERIGAGFALSDGEVDELAACAKALLDPRSRDLLALNARRIARPNGAAAAAHLLQSLV